MIVAVVLLLAMRSPLLQRHGLACARAQQEKASCINGECSPQFIQSPLIVANTMPSFSVEHAILTVAHYSDNWVKKRLGFHNSLHIDLGRRCVLCLDDAPRGLAHPASPGGVWRVWCRFGPPRVQYLVVRPECVIVHPLIVGDPRVYTCTCVLTVLLAAPLPEVAQGVFLGWSPSGGSDVVREHHCVRVVDVPQSE